jgi:hypothetical protein
MPEPDEDEELRKALGPAHYELLQTPYPELTPPQRAERARLFLVPFTTTNEIGRPLITSLLAQAGTANASQELAKILRDTAHEDVNFGGPDEEWKFVREAINQLVQYARADIANRPIHLRRVGLERIFGGSAGMWAGIRPENIDAVAANFIRIYAPELLNSVPPQARAQLTYREPVPEREERFTPEHERRESVGPHIDIIPPAGPSRDELNAEAGLLWTRASMGARLSILQELLDIPPATSSVYADRAFEKLPPFIRTSLRVNLGEARHLEQLSRREAPPTEEQRPQAPQPPPPPTETHVPEPISEAAPKEGVSLAQRYRPCRLNDIYDQVRAVNQLRGIVRTGVVGARGSAIILWGPPGTGKTTAAQAFARDYFINKGVIAATAENPCPRLPPEAFVKITKDRLPTDAQLASTTLAAILSTTIKSGVLTELANVKRIILVDDFSNLTPTVVEKLKPLLENYTGNAILLITMNPDPGRVFNDEAGAALLSRSQVIQFTPIPPDLIARRLHQIATAEHFSFPGLEDAITEASTMGDLGAAIGALQNAQNEYLGGGGAP